MYSPKELQNIQLLKGLVIGRNLKQEGAKKEVILSEEAFQKAVESEKLEVYSEDAIGVFNQNLLKAQMNPLTDKDELEKAKKDLNKLVKVKKSDKNGKVNTVYVKRKEGGSNASTPKSSTSTPSGYKSESKTKDEGLEVIRRMQSALKNPKTPAGMRKRAEAAIDVESLKWFKKKVAKEQPTKETPPKFSGDSEVDGIDIKYLAKLAIKNNPEFEDGFCTGECANISDDIFSSLKKEKKIKAQMLDVTNKTRKGAVGDDHTAVYLPDHDTVVDTQVWQFYGDEPDKFSTRQILFTKKEYENMGFVLGKVVEESKASKSNVDRKKLVHEIMSYTKKYDNVNLNRIPEERLVKIHKEVQDKRVKETPKKKESEEARNFGSQKAANSHAAYMERRRAEKNNKPEPKKSTETAKEKTPHEKLQDQYEQKRSEAAKVKIEALKEDDPEKKKELMSKHQKLDDEAYEINQKFRKEVDKMHNEKDKKDTVEKAEVSESLSYLLNL